MLNLRQWASELLGCEDWLTAYMFDRAVWWAGTYVQNKLDHYDQNTKSYPNTIESILGVSKSRKNGKGGIDDLARMMGGLMKVENGELKQA